MKLLGTIIGVFCLIGMFFGFLPFLGWLNLEGGSLLFHLTHCYFFHNLYDHTNLTWLDIYNSDAI